MRTPSQPAEPNAAIVLPLTVGHYWLVLGDLGVEAVQGVEDGDFMAFLGICSDEPPHCGQARRLGTGQPTQSFLVPLAPPSNHATTALMSHRV